MKTALTLVASFLIGTSFSLRAETIKFPEKDPAFSVTLPVGWTATTDKNGNLRCVAAEGGLTTVIMPQPEVKTDEDLAQFLVALAHEVAQQMELKDFRQGEINRSMTENGLKLFRLNASGTDPKGHEIILPLAGFAPRKGVYFVTSAPSPSAVYKAQQKENSEIINSIMPIR
ncbi:MAG: hypothetical protein QOE34_273 [Verrucomicrobiota bacterium]|jgi:hypothetical protein